jgi:hypothetical protein
MGLSRLNDAGRVPGARQRDKRRSAYSRDVNAEFNWWLLIVGLVVGAGLVWLVLADSRRREVDVLEAERQGEARWIAEAMSDAGRSTDDRDVLDILRLHAAYLAATPPDEAFDEPLEDGTEAGAQGWVAVPGASPVPDPITTTPDGRDRRSMAHPLGADRADNESGPA